MKSTQAWGWLAAGVLAAGLNAAYHDGGFEWAHRVADRAQHVSGAVVALASGRADRFLAEAETLTARNDDQATGFSDSMAAKADQQMARAEAAYSRAEARMAVVSARAQAHCARMQAERAGMEARRALVRIPDVHVETATIQIPGVPQISLPRISIPRMTFDNHCSHMRMSIPTMAPVNVSFRSGAAD